MSYYVYILLSEKDKKLYIGYSENIKERLNDHYKGLVISTKDRRPSKLIYYEYLLDKKDARIREKHLKSGGGRKHLKQMLKSTFNEVGYKFR